MTELTREVRDRIAALDGNDALEAVIQRLISKYQDSWRTTRPEDHAERERLYWMALSAERLRGEIHAIAAAEKVTAHNRRSRS